MDTSTDSSCLLPLGGGKIQTLDELIAELHVAFDGDVVDVDYVKTLLTTYKSNPRDWKKFAFFDPHRYTRNLIDTGNKKFNLFALCWSEGQGSSIHSHSDAHCFVKLLHGQLKETLYDWPAPDQSQTDQPLTQICVQTCSKNDVTYINDEIGLHRMENPSNVEGTVSLHLYSPPFGSCEKFDENTGHHVRVNVTFWSDRGTRPVGHPLDEDVPGVEWSQRINHRWRPLHEEETDDMQLLRCL